MNNNQLRNSLAEVYQDLREGKIDGKVAKELINASGKMLNSAKLDIEYRQYMKQERKKIDFLEGY